MSLSQLARSIRESATLKLNETAALLRDKGEPIIHLGGGEPKSKAPMDAVINCAALLNTGEIRYTAPDGIPALKKAIVRYTEEHYKKIVTAHNVIASGGAKQSLMVLLHAILDPKEEVVFPAPYWVSYPEMVKLAGGVAVPVTAEDGTFFPTVKEMADACGSYTKAPAALKGKVSYLADYSRLGFRGFMTDADHEALLKLGNNAPFVAAVDSLWAASREETQVSVENLPAGFSIPAASRAYVSYDGATHKLGIRGPMSTALRDELARDHFPLARPMTAEQRAAFVNEVESHGGKLSELQARTLDAALTKAWSIDGLQFALDEAGHAVPAEKSACELYQEQQSRKSGSATVPKTDAPKPEPHAKLNERQRAALDEFVRERTETVDDLAARLKSAGPFTANQNGALQEFFAKVPTVGEQKLNACIDLLRIGPLSREQRDFLRNDYREQTQWRQTVGELFVKAHKVKYPWSGQYNSPGSWFGWMYEYMFKPCTATMFSLLAFYVASAAFRAFRAKNVEALLLLGTAFIILLSQTFAGYWLTSWLPSDPQQNLLAWLRMENLKILIMRVFTTAGNRAILIGIALGIASTSIKIMLGQDRSYLGGE